MSFGLSDPSASSRIGRGCARSTARAKATPTTSRITSTGCTVASVLGHFASFPFSVRWYHAVGMRRVRTASAALLVNPRRWLSWLLSERPRAPPSFVLGGLDLECVGDASILLVFETYGHQVTAPPCPRWILVECRQGITPMSDPRLTHCDHSSMPFQLERMRYYDSAAAAIVGRSACNACRRAVFQWRAPCRSTSSYCTMEVAVIAQSRGAFLSYCRGSKPAEFP